MSVITQFRPMSLALADYRTYLFATLFVVGNIVLPQLCHFIPDGGKILLPIYFFTLVASYKFGIKVGLLTAVLSPLCNHLLFGMPPAILLSVILVKSSLLAVVASWVAARSRELSVIHLGGVVLVYQVLGGVAEWAIAGELSAALQDFLLGFPGILLQIVGGWLVLRLLSKYEI